MPTKVFLGGISEATRKEDVEDFFKGYGELSMVWVARNPPGFGFVEFADERDAQDACRDLDGKELRGRPVRVEVSTGRRRESRGDRSDACYECGSTGHFARDCRLRRGRSPYGGRDRYSRRSRSPRRSPPRGRSPRRSPSPRGRSPPPRDRSRSPRRGSPPRDDRYRRASPERRRSRSR